MQITITKNMRQTTITMMRKMLLFVNCFHHGITPTNTRTFYSFWRVQTLALVCIVCINNAMNSRQPPKEQTNDATSAEIKQFLSKLEACPQLTRGRVSIGRKKSMRTQEKSVFNVSVLNKPMCMHLTSLHAAQNEEENFVPAELDCFFTWHSDLTTLLLVRYIKTATSSYTG